jgi:carbamoyltransferase
MFRRDAQQLPTIDRAFLGDQIAGESGFAREFCRRARIDARALEHDIALRAAVASSAQAMLEETIVEIVRTFRARAACSNLCVAGGVFLNALLVRALEERSGFDRVFVQPVAGNAGTALGAAYLGQARVNGRIERTALRDLFLGPRSAATEIKAVLDNCKLIYDYVPIEDKLLADVTRLLAGHRIVAWYHGRAEFGNRTLGNRAILASPFSPYVVDNLNQYIKHREPFHPFALSVPEDVADQYFEYSPASRFMATVGRFKARHAGLEQFAFGGGRVRVHVVGRECSTRFWKLLHAFGREAPAPILVNTSFNLFGEPAVTEPREAIRSFYCAGIDALVLEDFVVVKS